MGLNSHQNWNHPLAFDLYVCEIVGRKLHSLSVNKEL